MEAERAMFGSKPVVLEAKRFQPWFYICETCGTEKRFESGGDAARTGALAHLHTHPGHFVRRYALIEVDEVRIRKIRSVIDDVRR